MIRKTREALNPIQASLLNILLGELQKSDSFQGIKKCFGKRRLSPSYYCFCRKEILWNIKHPDKHIVLFHEIVHGIDHLYLDFKPARRLVCLGLPMTTLRDIQFSLGIDFMQYDLNEFYTYQGNPTEPEILITKMGDSLQEEEGLRVSSIILEFLAFFWEWLFQSLRMTCKKSKRCMRKYWLVDLPQYFKSPFSWSSRQRKARKVLGYLMYISTPLWEFILSQNYDALLYSHIYNLHKKLSNIALSPLNEPHPRSSAAKSS